MPPHGCGDDVDTFEVFMVWISESLRQASSNVHEFVCNQTCVCGQAVNLSR
jgi:hypothetical protein